MKPIIALLTDFGTRDPWSGIMKGVIAGMSDSTIIDLTHQIAPQDVLEASLALYSAYRYFPDKTIFCSVVDPGVGSLRRAIAVEAQFQGKTFFFVCPDNGLLTAVLKEAQPIRVVSLDNSMFHLPLSSTFHGRDIFAPVAAQLANGVALEQFGSAVAATDLISLDWPEVSLHEGIWQAQVIHIDHFGNLLTNLPRDRLEPPFSQYAVSLADKTFLGIRQTFADVQLGEGLAYFGSSGFLELAIRQGNASRDWACKVGTPIRLKRMA
jgi:S-adenosyl-L-methionine hydrolase (adenosine-forming)